MTSGFRISVSGGQPGAGRVRKLNADAAVIDEETMTVLMDELGTIQDMLTMHDFT